MLASRAISHKAIGLPPESPSLARRTCKGTKVVYRIASGEPPMVPLQKYWYHFKVAMASSTLPSCKVRQPNSHF